MRIIAVITAVVLIAGCASTGAGIGGSNSGSTMLTEAQLESKNPYLLDCPRNASPICDIEGGRTRQVFTNCRCVRY